MMHASRMGISESVPFATPVDVISRWFLGDASLLSPSLTALPQTYRKALQDSGVDVVQ
jgi:hypothetical protein